MIARLNCKVIEEENVNLFKLSLISTSTILNMLSIYILMLRRMAYLYILHGARLGHTQHVEQLQDQLLDVLQGILLRHEVWVDLLLHLNVRDKRKKTPK